jgi:hypothetical protein
MLLTNKQMSVLGDTKYQGVQTLLVIGVTVTLVTSCWARGVTLSSPPSVGPSGQQLDAIFPVFFPLLPLYQEGRGFDYPLNPTSMHRTAQS